jgi:hypothetical protein
VLVVVVLALTLVVELVTLVAALATGLESE